MWMDSTFQISFTFFPTVVLYLHDQSKHFILFCHSISHIGFGFSSVVKCICWKTSGSNQCEITGLGFMFPFESNKQRTDKIWNSGFQGNGHQATKNSDSWEETTKWGGPSGCHSIFALEKFLGKKGESGERLADPWSWGDRGKCLNR